MKMSKIKEVLLKKRLILEEICQGAHMIVGQFGKDLSLESIESGMAPFTKFTVTNYEFQFLNNRFNKIVYRGISNYLVNRKE